MLPDVSIIKARFFLRPVNTISITGYKGSAIRGLLGNALKRTYCTEKKADCSTCRSNLFCQYYAFFETPIDDKIPKNTLRYLKLSNNEKAPLPFVIEPAQEEIKDYSKNDLLTFGILLFGINAFEYFTIIRRAVFTGEVLGLGKAGGKYKTEKIEIFTSDFKPAVCFNIDKALINDIELNSAKYKISLNPVTEKRNKLELNFTTPLRLQSKKQLMEKIDFRCLLISLVRRVSSILVFHYGFEITKEYISHTKELITLASDIIIYEDNLVMESWQRWSNRQKIKMDMSGLIGKISFNGNISPFLSFIYYGSILHAGKNSVFGLGKYEIL